MRNVSKEILDMWFTDCAGIWNKWCVLVFSYCFCRLWRGRRLLHEGPADMSSLLPKRQGCFVFKQSCRKTQTGEYSFYFMKPCMTLYVLHYMTNAIMKSLGVRKGGQRNKAVCRFCCLLRAWESMLPVEMLVCLVLLSMNTNLSVAIGTAVQNCSAALCLKHWSFVFHSLYFNEIQSSHGTDLFKHV